MTRMQHVLLILMLCIICYSSPAQEFYAGAGFAMSERSSNSFITDSVSLSTSFAAGRKYIIPHLGAEFRLSEKIDLQTEIGYRRHTISLSYWDNRADTCTLCPVKKGGGPTFDELRVAGRVKYHIKRTRPEIFALFGMLCKVPFNRKDNAVILPSNLQAVAKSGESVKSASIVYEIGVGLQFSRIQVDILRSHDPGYTRTITLNDNSKVPFRTSEGLWQCRLSFCLNRRSQ